MHAPRTLLTLGALALIIVVAGLFLSSTAGPATAAGESSPSTRATATAAL